MRKATETMEQSDLIINFKNYFHNTSATALVYKDRNNHYYMKPKAFARLWKKLCPFPRCRCQKKLLESIPREGIKYIIDPRNSEFPSVIPTRSNR